MNVVHDWSKLDDDGHKSKNDLTQISQKLDRGYALTGTLLVDGGGRRSVSGRVAGMGRLAMRSMFFKH